MRDVHNFLNDTYRGLGEVILILSLFVVILPVPEFFTHVEKSLLPVKGNANFDISWTLMAI